jgi:hypothetical protein
MNTMLSTSSKFRAFLGLFLCLSFMTSCEDHNHSDEPNSVTIELLNPMAGEKVLDPSKTNFSVNFSATIEQHKLEVTLTPSDKLDQKIISWTKNTHEKYFEYRNTLDLSIFEAGTNFLLTLKSCSDHECGDFLVREVIFSI